MPRKKVAAKKTTEKIISALLSGKMGEEYRRKYVVVIGEEAHIIPSKNQGKFIEKLRKKFPRKTPHIVFVPGPETYILFL